MSNWKELATYVGNSEAHVTPFYDGTGQLISDQDGDKLIQADTSVAIEPSSFAQDWGMTSGSGTGKGGSLNWEYHSTHEWTIPSRDHTHMSNIDYDWSAKTGCDSNGVFGLKDASVEFTAPQYNGWYDGSVNPWTALVGGQLLANSTTGFKRPICLKVDDSSEHKRRTNSPWFLAPFSGANTHSAWPESGGGAEGHNFQASGYSPSWDNSLSSIDVDITDTGTPAFWARGMDSGIGEGQGSFMCMATRHNGGHWIGATTNNMAGFVAVTPLVGFRYYDETHWGPFITSPSDGTANHTHDTRYITAQPSSDQVQRIKSDFTYDAEGIDGNVYLGPNNWVEEITAVDGSKWQVYSFFKRKDDAGVVHQLGDTATTPANLQDLLSLDEGDTNQEACTGQQLGDGYPGGKRLKIWSATYEAAMSVDFSEGGQFFEQAAAVAASDRTHFSLTNPSGDAKTYVFTSGYSFPYFYDNSTSTYLQGAPVSNPTVVSYAYESSTQIGNNFCSDTNWDANAASFDESTPITLATTGIGANQWLVCGRYFVIMSEDASAGADIQLASGFKEAHADVGMTKVTWKFENLYRCSYVNSASTHGNLTLPNDNGLGNLTITLSGSLGHVNIDTGSNATVIGGQSLLSTVGNTIGGTTETIGLAAGGISTPLAEITNTGLTNSPNARVWLEESDDLDIEFGLRMAGGVSGGGDVFDGQCQTGTFHVSGLVNGVASSTVEDELADITGRFSSIVDTVDEAMLVFGGSGAEDTWMPTANLFNTYLDKTTMGFDMIVVKGSSINIGTSSSHVTGTDGTHDKIFVNLDSTASGGSV